MPEGTLLALYRDPEEVAEALDALREAGILDDRFEVLSGAPYPEGAFGERHATHHLYVYPLVGAACGFAFGLLVTIGTQLSYPLVTGGKPLLSIPPMLTVIYGGTLLGAILLTVAGVLIESRLPRFDRLPYDPRISQGYLGVLVNGADGPSARSAVERALRSAGAVEIVTPDGEQMHAPAGRRAST